MCLFHGSQGVPLQPSQLHTCPATDCVNPEQISKTQEIFVPWSIDFFKLQCLLDEMISLKYVVKRIVLDRYNNKYKFFFFPLWTVTPKERIQLFCSFQMTLYKNQAIKTGALDVHDTSLVHFVCFEAFLLYKTLKMTKSGKFKRGTHMYAFSSIINNKIRPSVVQNNT